MSVPYRQLVSFLIPSDDRTLFKDLILPEGTTEWGVQIEEARLTDHAFMQNMGIACGMAFARKVRKDKGLSELGEP